MLISMLISTSFSVGDVPPDFEPKGLDPLAVDEDLPPSGALVRDRCHRTLREIGKKHGKSAAQVALRWAVEQGALPIPGAKDGAQAREKAGALTRFVRSAMSPTTSGRGWRSDAVVTR
jgi:hypothetical protein